MGHESEYKKHESRWKWFTVVSAHGEVLRIRCASCELLAKRTSIKYENRKFRCAYCMLIATTIRVYCLALFSFSARCLVYFLPLSLSSVTSLAFTAFRIHFSYASAAERMATHDSGSYTHTHTHISTAKIRIVSAKWFTNSSGKICICFFVSHSGRFFLHFIFRFVCFY